MVSETVSKKFGTEKSPRTGLGKFWYRKKYRNRSQKNLVPKKVPESVSENFRTEKVSESVSFRFWVLSHTAERTSGVSPVNFKVDELTQVTSYAPECLNYIAMPVKAFFSVFFYTPANLLPPFQISFF